jgi:hypothetical protein
MPSTSNRACRASFVNRIVKMSPAPDRRREGRFSPIGFLSYDLRHVRLNVDALKCLLQCLAHERRMVVHDDLGEKHVLFSRLPLTPGTDVRGRQPEAHREKVEGTRGKDDEAEVRKLEHREGLPDEFPGDAARQKVCGGADEREHAPGHRRKRERH